MAANPVFEGDPKSGSLILTPGHATRFAKVYQAGANGGRITQGFAASSDGTANTLKVAIGRRITLQTAMGVGTFVDGGGGSDAITRTVGSFLTDSWKVGDRIHPDLPTTLANEFDALLTAVAALTLTFATATVNTGEVMPAESSIFRLTQIGLLDLAASAGFIAGAPGVPLLNELEIPGLDASPDRFIQLGPNDALFVAAGTLLGAGETIDVFASGRDN